MCVRVCVSESIEILRGAHGKCTWLLALLFPSDEYAQTHTFIHVCMPICRWDERYRNIDLEPQITQRKESNKMVLLSPWCNSTQCRVQTLGLDTLCGNNLLSKHVTTLKTYAKHHCKFRTLSKEHFKTLLSLNWLTFQCSRIRNQRISFPFGFKTSIITAVSSLSLNFIIFFFGHRKCRKYWFISNFYFCSCTFFYFFFVRKYFEVFAWNIYELSLLSVPFLDKNGRD